MNRSQYERALTTFADLLRNEAHTAKDLAALAGISKPSVYARLRALRARGYQITTRKQRQGKTLFDRI